LAVILSPPRVGSPERKWWKLERRRRTGRLAPAFAANLSHSIRSQPLAGRLNPYPADCDCFERIHIKAPTREAACSSLADMMREKALATTSGPGYKLIEVKCGRHPVEAKKGGKAPSRRSTPAASS